MLQLNFRYPQKPRIYGVFATSLDRKIMVTVYSLPNCVQCESTKKFLNKNLIEYTEVDMSKDNDALEKVREWGFTQAPVVEYEGKAWSGFRFDMLNTIAA